MMYSVGAWLALQFIHASLPRGVRHELTRCKVYQGSWEKYARHDCVAKLPQAGLSYLQGHQWSGSGCAVESLEAAMEDGQRVAAGHGHRPRRRCMQSGRTDVRLCAAAPAGHPPDPAHGKLRSPAGELVGPRDRR